MPSPDVADRVFARLKSKALPATLKLNVDVTRQDQKKAAADVRTIMETIPAGTVLAHAQDDKGVPLPIDDAAFEKLKLEYKTELEAGAPYVPGGSGVSTPMSTPTSTRDWPLWEVFVRARRGLSHVHAGSLHAPDAEMALRNARDLYTRRGEGVSLWVVQAVRHRGVDARRARLVLRPGGRQDLPPPDVLRRPRGGGAPLMRHPAASTTRSAWPTTPWSPPSGWAGGSAARPELEEDVALANIGLDQLGQARTLLTYAGEVEGAGRTEDDLAYLRDDREFRNVKLVERPMTDFGVAMARLLVFSTYQSHLYRALRRRQRRDAGRRSPAKAVKEVAYHVDHAAHWVLRLGDGTDESHAPDAGRRSTPSGPTSTSCSTPVDPALAGRRRRPGRAARRRPGRRTPGGRARRR